ncbi:MarR family transcriptional regulator [Clostridium sp.]|uniref:MarR family winged helix-turn-helix transcriptional regulator n=1 Tax=Clostridium sp. TaxID=1506 RepID=UPI0028431829|nr:MarR family transcriptional regulator [Clostridium sp.]MDR3594979.1 MarR family transcriptional regulator [Clostridium sp.]
MDKECKRQVNELNRLWHRMLTESNYKETEAKYKNMKEISTTELAIIRIISEKEDVIIKDIIEVLNLPKSTLTSIIDRLEKRNLISRAISKRDRRSYRLELTEQGKIVQDEHIKFEEEVYGKIITSLDTYEEREEFLKFIKKIGDNISKR